MEQVDGSTLKALVELLSLSKIAFAIGIIIVAWLTLKLLRVLLERLARRFNRYRLQITGSLPILGFLVWASAIGIIMFVILGPSKNVMLTVIASIGIAGGLAAQDGLKNAIAGILMLVHRPFQVGDMVRMGEHYGEVTDIGIQTTRLRTFDDSTITIPNGQVVTQAVTNSNSGELSEQVAIPFDLPATVDINEIRRLAWEAAVCSPYAYLKKPVLVLVEDRFDYVFLTRFTVKVYVIDVRLEMILASDIISRIKQALLQRGLLSDIVKRREPQAMGRR